MCRGVSKKRVRAMRFLQSFLRTLKKKFNHASNVGDGVMKVSLVMKGLSIKTSA